VEVAQNAALNLGEEYDEDYPVIFNILLWSAIAFIFTLIAISCKFVKRKVVQDFFL
jgi:Renin receptor-like protein.